MPLDDTTVLTRDPAAIGTPMGDTVVLLDVRGEYLELNPVGVAVWEALETPRPLGALVVQLAAEFGVEGDVVRRDVQTFLTTLSERGLLRLG